jgi:transcriptional regulator with XRE-family HTH domain
MSGKIQMTGRLVAAARALTGISQADFAAAAGLPIEALCLIESNGSAWLSSARDAEAVSSGLTHFGVIVIGESDGMGAGVRLKFTRQDVKQIGILESEGGIVRSDDAP